MLLSDSGRVPFADTAAFFRAGSTQLHINKADCDRLSDYKKYKDSLIHRATYQYHPVVDSSQVAATRLSPQSYDPKLPPLHLQSYISNLGRYATKAMQWSPACESGYTASISPSPNSYYLRRSDSVGRIPIRLNTTPRHPFFEKQSAADPSPQQYNAPRSLSNIEDYGKLPTRLYITPKNFQIKPSLTPDVGPYDLRDYDYKSRKIQ